MLKKEKGIWGNKGKRKVDKIEGGKYEEIIWRAINMKQCSLTESTKKILSIYSLFTLVPKLR